MHPLHIFITSLCTYNIGIISYHFLQIEINLQIIIIVIISSLMIICLSPNKYKLIIPLAFFIFAYTHHQNKYQIPTNHISHFNNKEEQIITGQIIKQPDHRETKSNYTIKVQTNNNQKSQGKILLKIPRYPELKYLDIITLKTKIESPPEDENFSYKKYLSRFEIYSITKNPKIISITKIKSKTIKQKIFEKIFIYKNNFENKINTVFPEPQSSLANGLLLGSKKGLPKDIQEHFQITGLTHIIAISGSNIAIIALISMSILNWLPRKITLITTISIIILFCITTGAEAAVVRASITGIISLLAMLSFKKSHTFLTLLIALSIMLTISPRMFFYDAGFALSFSATIGVIYFHTIIQKITDPLKLPNFLAIKDSFNLTLAAQITTLPIMIHLFGNISLISPVANLLVDPLLTPAMFLPLITVLLEKITPLFFILKITTMIYIDLLTEFTKLCANIPYAQIEIKTISPLFTFLYYTALIIILIKKRSHTTPLTNNQFHH